MNGTNRMNLNQFIEDSLNQERGMLLEALDGLTPEELAWQPGPESNPIGWTVWHMMRVEDMWVQFFAQRQTEMWERDGWNDKFGLPTRDNGFNHTPQQVADFPSLDLPLLLQYGDAVRAATLEYLRGLDDAGMEATPRSDRPDVWWHSFSVGAMFRQLVGEFYQHLGQIAYLRGLRRGFDAVPPGFATPR